MNKPPAERENFNVVIVGHVDHGKSTVVGRLLADTGSLPQGKLESVKRECERTGKPFEYAFLLDALSDEQDQGITIDTARCFFKSATRDYIIIDAPGHIEFLKNMISGAARAEAAVLVIDAKEGVRENSRRHGYILSMLGIRQVVVCVNKMDLVDYNQDHFNAIEKEYRAFLEGIGAVSPRQFVPVAAVAGVNLANRGKETPWYKGPTLLEVLDDLPKAPPTDRPAAAHAGAGGLQVHRARRRSPHLRRADRGRARRGRRQGGVLAVEQDLDHQEHRGVQRGAAHQHRRRLVDRVHADRGDLRDPRRGDEPRRQAAAGVDAPADEPDLAGQEAVRHGARLQAQARHRRGAGAARQDQQGDRRAARSTPASRRTTSAATTSPTSSWSSSSRSRST